MKMRLVLLCLAGFPVLAFGASVVKLVREPGTLALSIQQGYGVQKDGKHELTISSVSSGQTIKTIKSFKGRTAPEDKKYFNRLEAITIPETAGKLRISGRIFYCSFSQKFCSVQKVDQEL